jgi:hypothetical protein
MPSWADFITATRVFKFSVHTAFPRPRRFDGGFRLRDDFCMGPSKNDATSASHHPRPRQQCCAAGPLEDQLSHPSNARFARECQSFLQESRQYECRTCGGCGRFDSPVEARNAYGRPLNAARSKWTLRAKAGRLSWWRRGSISKLRSRRRHGGGLGLFKFR